MYVCMCVRMCVRMYVRTYVCMYVCVYVCTYVRTYLYMYVLTYVCMCVCWLLISLNMHYFKIVMAAVRFSILAFAAGTWPISRAALHKECRLEIH